MFKCRTHERSPWFEHPILAISMVVSRQKIVVFYAKIWTRPRGFRGGPDDLRNGLIPSFTAAAVEWLGIDLPGETWWNGTSHTLDRKDMSRCRYRLSHAEGVSFGFLAYACIMDDDHQRKTWQSLQHLAFLDILLCLQPSRVIFPGKYRQPIGINSWESARNFKHIVINWLDLIN